jgi:hypothetical protein
MAVFLAAPALYALQRAYDVLARGPEASPARIVWQPHIAVFWRIATSLHVGGMVAFVVYAAAGKNLVKTMHVLCAGTVVVSILIAVQGLFLP